MKKHCLISVFTLLVIAFTTSPILAQDVPLKIGVVDFEKIERVAESSRSIQTQIKEIGKGLQTQFAQSENELRQAQQDLLNKQALLSPDAFQEERRKFEQKFIKSKQSAQKQQQNLQRAHIRAQDQLKRKLAEIILKFSSDNGYTLVLKRSQTAIVAAKFDITDQIITELNKQMPSVKVQLGQ